MQMPFLMSSARQGCCCGLACVCVCVCVCVEECEWVCWCKMLCMCVLGENVYSALSWSQAYHASGYVCVCVCEVSYTQVKALQDLHYDDMELCVTTTSSWRGTALQKTQSAEIKSYQSSSYPPLSELTSVFPVPLYICENTVEPLSEGRTLLA